MSDYGMHDNGMHDNGNNMQHNKSSDMHDNSNDIHDNSNDMHDNGNDMHDNDSAKDISEESETVEDFVQKLPGLYVAKESTNERGQTSVVREDPGDNKIYPVWDSTWDQTREPPPLPDSLAIVASDGPRHILTMPARLEETVTVHLTPPEGQQTTIYIHPSNSVDQRIPLYMRKLSAADVSEEDLAKPIPPYNPSAGGKDDARQGMLAKFPMVKKAVSKNKEGDAQDEDRPVAHSSDAVATSGADSEGSADVPFLYVYEHHSSYAKLTFDSPSTLRLQRSKADAVDSIIYLKEQDGDAPVYVEYYRFKKGYTLRFNDCGATKEIKWKKTAAEKELMKRKSKKKDEKTPAGDTEKKESISWNKEWQYWKEFHVYFPPDRWNTGFHHETWTDDYKVGYGTYDEAQAWHNVLAFPDFLDELDERFKAEKVEDTKVEEIARKDGKVKRQRRKKEKAGVKPELEDEEGNRVFILRRRKEEGKLAPDISVRVSEEEEGRIARARDDQEVREDALWAEEEAGENAVREEWEATAEEEDDHMEMDMDLDTD